MQYAKPVTLNVEECDRLSFLPYLFGLDFLYAEASVYALAKKMMPEYEGGFWHFIRLPDGGGYMMPDGDRFHMVNGANWFDRTVSADAAGIILTSLVINRQLWLYHDSGDAGLTQLYRMRDAQLWRHIEFHPECFWHFIRLPDGGGYMMPDGDRFHMVNGANWFDRTVSADAAGIILTSLVINRQLWLYHDSGDAGLTQLYRMRDAQLWRHIEFHPECNAIYAALD